MWRLVQGILAYDLAILKDESRLRILSLSFHNEITATSHKMVVTEITLQIGHK